MDEAKRQSILDAAGKAFSQLGYKKTSIDDIAKAAGVAKGTVYLACESKEELFYQVVTQDLRRFVGSLAVLIDPLKPADETMVMLSVQALRFFDEFPLVRDLFHGVHHGHHPKWAERFETLRAMGRANIAEIIRLGIRQGRFRDDLNIEETAGILQDFQTAAVLLNSRVGLPEEEMKARVEKGFRLIFEGLRKPPGSA